MHCPFLYADLDTDKALKRGEAQYDMQKGTAMSPFSVCLGLTKIIIFWNLILPFSS